jgi:hypothetical protein
MSVGLTRVLVSAIGNHLVKSGLELLSGSLKGGILLLTLSLSFTTAIAEGNKAPSVPTSSNDDYRGDCFHLHVETTIIENGKQRTLQPGWYLTLKQDGENLHLLKVESQGFICSSSKPSFESNGSTHPIEVSMKPDDLDGRATRTGWIYGILILPFKYHLNDNSFSGETTVGPYLGRRSSIRDTSFSWAVTAGMTPISADSIDQTGAVKSTPLTAFTYAAGLMFEVNKGPAPMKIGVFFGQDVVSSDSAVSYKHDRKNWLALQVGWDLTSK